MAELGALEIKLVQEGMTEILNALKSVEKAVMDLADKEKSLNNQRVRSNSARAKDLNDLAKKARIAEAETTKVTKQEIEKRETDYKRLYEEIPREAEKAAKRQQESEQKLTRQMTEEQRKRTAEMGKALKQQESEQRASVRRQAENYNRYIGKPLGSALQRGAQTTGLLAGGALAFASGSMLNTAFEQEKELHKVVGQVVRSSNLPGSAGPVLKHDELMKEIRGTSQELGMSPVDVAESYLALSRHGRPELAKTFGKDIARWSFAEDIEPDKLADTLQGFARQNPRATDENLRNLMMHAIGQGKRFNLPIAEMSTALGAATASASLFGNQAGGQALVQNQLMGMMQIARQGGATSAPEAAMAIKSFYGEIAKAAGTPKRLAKAGLTQSDILDKQGQLLPANSIIETVLAKTHGRINQLEGIVSQRGMRLIQGLLPTYKEGGIPAVRNELLNVERTKADEDLIRQDIAQRQKDEIISVEMQKHINDLAVNINDHFPAIISAMDKFGAIESSLGTNLLTTIGGTGAGAALGVGIGTLLKNLVTANMNVQAANVNVVGAGGVISGVAGTAGGSLLGRGLAALGGAAGAGATAAGGALTLGVGALAAGSLYMTYDQATKLARETSTMTAKELTTGSAAQFVNNKWTENKNADILDKFLIGMGGLLVKVADVTGIIGPDHKSVAGPMGANLPGMNK